MPSNMSKYALPFKLYVHLKVNITYINIYTHIHIYIYMYIDTFINEIYIYSHMIYMAQGTFKKPDPN